MSDTSRPSNANKATDLPANTVNERDSPSSQPCEKCDQTGCRRSTIEKRIIIGTWVFGAFFAVSKLMEPIMEYRHQNPDEWMVMIFLRYLHYLIALAALRHLFDAGLKSLRQ